MNKKIIAAAVAATMTSVAFADISITGAMKANYKNIDNNGTVTNQITTEADLVVTGKTGDTEVRFEINSDSEDSAPAGKDNLDIEDQWMATKVGDARIQVGTWNGSDSIISADSTRTTGKWMVDQTIAGLQLKLKVATLKILILEVMLLLVNHTMVRFLTHFQALLLVMQFLLKLRMLKTNTRSLVSTLV